MGRGAASALGMVRHGLAALPLLASFSIQSIKHCGVHSAKEPADSRVPLLLEDKPRCEGEETDGRSGWIAHCEDGSELGQHLPPGLRPPTPGVLQRRPRGWQTLPVFVQGN